VNAWQILRQAASIFAETVWPGSGGEIVTANVVPTAALAEQVLGELRPGPFVLINAGEAKPDDQHPGLVAFDLRTSIGVMLGGDMTGETQLIGGHRGSLGHLSSMGRGVLEVEEVLIDALELGTAALGINAVLAWSSGVAAGMLKGRHITVRDHVFRCLGTLAREYHPATRLAGAYPGGGVANLTWALPPDRFDRDSVVLKRASGSTAPATVADGTPVTLSGDLATSVADSPGAGTFSWALFAAYDEGRGGDLRYAAAATLTGVVT